MRLSRARHPAGQRQRKIDRDRGELAPPPVRSRHGGKDVVRRGLGERHDPRFRSGRLTRTPVREERLEPEVLLGRGLDGLPLGRVRVDRINARDELFGHA